MWRTLIAVASVALGSAGAVSQETVKIGLILPMTGPFATTGKQVEAGARVYMQQNGATVAGKKIEMILRDEISSSPPWRM
jgi:branched-chain amino acid transport system substrate-binding protein